MATKLTNVPKQCEINLSWTPDCCEINVSLIIETALEHYCGNTCTEARPVVCPEACPEACPEVCPETFFCGPENLLRRTGSGPVSWEAIFTCEADGRVVETGCTGPLCQLTGPLWQLTGPLCQLTGPPFQLCFCRYLAPSANTSAGTFLGTFFIGPPGGWKPRSLPPVSCFIWWWLKEFSL